MKETIFDLNKIRMEISFNSYEELRLKLSFFQNQNINKIQRVSHLFHQLLLMLIVKMHNLLQSNLSIRDFNNKINRNKVKIKKLKIK